MKVKFSLIPFIPVAIASIALKLFSVFGLDDNGLFMGMNKVTISYLAIALALFLFLVCVVINIFDRKTAPVYSVKKNPVAGVMSALAGVGMVAISFLELMSVDPTDEYYIVYLFSALISIVAVVVLALMSKIHFTGNAVTSGISALFVFPALWGCVELISEFLNSTKASISTSDMTEMFCYIFLTLYLFAQSMILSRVKGRNPVKACFIYGLPAVSIALTYGSYIIANFVKENTGLKTVVSGVSYILIAVYVLVFVIELSRNSLTKSEVEIIEELDYEEDSYIESYVKSGGYDEIVYSNRSNEEDAADAEVEVDEDHIPYIEGLDDFVMGFKENNDIPDTYIKNRETKVNNKNNEKKEGNPFALIAKDSKVDESASDIDDEHIDDFKFAVINDESIDEVDSKGLASKKPLSKKTASDESVSSTQNNSVKTSARKKNENIKINRRGPQKPNTELSDIDLLLQELDSKK
jgi:hypothetical protein